MATLFGADMDRAYAAQRSVELVDAYLNEFAAIFLSREPHKADLIEIARRAILETLDCGDR